MKIKFYVVSIDDAEMFNFTDKELAVYSIIKGFSQDGVSAYEGGHEELARAARCSIATLKRVLTSLNDKGIIKKEFVTFGNNRYRVIDTTAQNEPSMAQNDPCTTAQNEPPYINNIINKSKENIIKEKGFVKPTIEEIAAYCRGRGNSVNAELFYAHYEANGWMVGRNHMKDWRRAVITWELNNNSNGQRTTSTSGDPVAKMRDKQAANDAAIQLGANLDLGF